MRAQTKEVNDHLKEFMEGLTAKVFRTYNASVTLEKVASGIAKAHRPDSIHRQELVKDGVDVSKMDEIEKVAFYNRFVRRAVAAAAAAALTRADSCSANREVAILCNHQRTVPKGAR